MSIWTELSSGIFTSELFASWIYVPVLGLLIIAGWGSTQVIKHQRKRRLEDHAPREERQKLSLPLVIKSEFDHEISVRTYDISLSGAFLNYEDLKESMTFTSLIGKRKGIKIGDLLEVKVLTGRFSYIKCQARVVRHNLDQEQPWPPLGIGIEFLDLTARKRKALAEVLLEKNHELVPSA